MKPNILVVQDTKGTIFKHTTARYFKSLSHRYTFHFYTPDYSVNPHDYVEQIAADVRKKKLQIHGTFSLLDRENVLTSLIAKKLRLLGPSPESIFRAQHKQIFTNYMMQADRDFPKTFTMHRKNREFKKIIYPCFIRPVRGSFSRNSYSIRSSEELKKATRPKNIKQVEREYYAWYRAAFNKIATRSASPIGTSYIVQPLIKGNMYNVDGFVKDGKITILGYVEAITTGEGNSFIRFDYPAQLSITIQKKVQDLLQKLLEAIKYDNSGFNVEFFVTKDRKVVFIEMNTRISRQFVPLMLQTYKINTIEMMAELAIGKNPNIQKKKSIKIASSFPLRVFTDHYVERVPSKKELNAIRKLPGVLDVSIYVHKGKYLSEYIQDSYSYRYGILDIAEKDMQEIQKRLETIKNRIPVRLIERSK